jgi:hypothetical protein
MEWPEIILPLHITRILSRISNLINVLFTKVGAGLNGIPTPSENANGAAPVPPSVPSTVIKSGKQFCRIISWQINSNSLVCPMHSLKPMGFPFANSRNKATNFIKPVAS